MPNWSGTGDMTTNNLPNKGGRGIQSYRPVANTTYPVGACLQLVSIDKQIFPDFQTVTVCAAASAASISSVGVVSDTWGGFSPTLGFVNVTGNEALVRGTQFVEAVVKGVQPVLVDQSGSGAVTITDGTPLVVSKVTAGYAQGQSKQAPAGALTTVGVASLPGSGIGSSLTAAALAQASQTATVAGTPAAGDVLTLTIQSPYTTAAPGVVQTTSWNLTLNSTTAASATTAAAAMVAYLNAQPNFSQYFIATNAAGVITVTVNALSTAFLVTFGSGSTVTGQFNTSISGMVANTLTFATSVSSGAGSTFTAGSTTFASGTGYFGFVPAMILGEF